jgi:hypothetical protein
MRNRTSTSKKALNKSIHMIKINIIPPALLAAAALAALAPSARAQTTLSYSTGDLVLGFNDPNVAGDDYVVDLGQASYFLTLAQTPGTTNVTASDPAYGGASLGNLASDLSTIFGTTWYDNNAQGDNVQWGIIGASGKSAATGSIPKDTIFLTQPENFPGAGSNDPSEGSTGTQTGWNNQIIGFTTVGNGFNAATTSTNSNYAVEEPTSFTDAWSNNNLNSNAFGTNLNIEQSQNAGLTDIGPTNSQLDLYELLPTSEGGTGTGTELGSFTLSTSGQLEFTSAVPEPSTYAAVILGAALLYVFRRPRKSIIG